MSDRCVYRTSGPNFSAAQVAETSNGKFIVKYYRFNQWLTCGELFDVLQRAARLAVFLDAVGRKLERKEID